MEHLTLEQLANKHLDDSVRKEKLLVKVYFAIKSDELMQNNADCPEISKLTSVIGKEIGAE
jgi:hypothetical protein